MTYAVEVAKTGSINKAAETLLVAQPNLSRSIKELEADLGITIFNRSSKGMTMTPEGEQFIGYAKRILEQIDKVEGLYKNGPAAHQRFSVSVPRVSYISDAFSRFTTGIGPAAAEIYYNETNASHTLQHVASGEYNLGIVRYAEHFDEYFKRSFEEKGLECELISSFSYILLMNRAHPLASKEEVYLADLEPYIEIAHADPAVPSLTLAAARRGDLPETVKRRIYIFERGSQFCILGQNHEAFMWVSPVPVRLLQRYDLVQRDCRDFQKPYKDVLIYRKDYRFSELDERFITELCQSRRNVFSD